MIFKLLIGLGRHLSWWQRYLFTIVTSGGLVALWWHYQGNTIYTQYTQETTTPLPDTIQDTIPQEPVTTAYIPATLAQLNSLAQEHHLTVEHAYRDKSYFTITLEGSFEHKLQFLTAISDQKILLDEILMTETLLSITVLT